MMGGEADGSDVGEVIAARMDSAVSGCVSAE